MGGSSTEPEEGLLTSQPGRRKKRFLAPQEKYEIWMQLVRGETTVADAAEAARVDRSTIAKLREVARQGALDALAQSRLGRRETQVPGRHEPRRVPHSEAPRVWWRCPANRGKDMDLLAYLHHFKGRQRRVIHTR